MNIHTINFKKKVDNKIQAVFVIIYSIDGKPWYNYKGIDEERKNLVIPTCLMINRWDGCIGFIGGKVENGMTFEETIRKEVKEEIGLSFSFELEPIVAHDIGPVTTHAYASKVSYEVLMHIQKDAALAEHIGSEVTGVFSPHLIDYQETTHKRKGGIVELFKSSIVPSGREEFTHFLLKKKIYSRKKLKEFTEKAGYSLENLLQ